MRILSNGSKWAGEDPDPVEKLIEVLKTHKLRQEFIDYEVFSQIGEDEYQAWGNFEDLSHVFDIRGTKEEMEPLRLAIEENYQKFGYKIKKKRRK